MTKHRNDELKAADLVNYVVLASVYTTIRTNSQHHTVQPLTMGKMRTADLRNIQWVSRPYVDKDRTLTRTTTLTETLTLTITLTLKPYIAIL